MEIITGVERRRRWRPEEKLRVLAELGEPRARFNDVARRHDVSRGLLWQWREAQRSGRLVEEMPVFVPLRVVPELPAPEPGREARTALTAQAGPDSLVEVGERPVEIVLPDGTVVRVGEAIALPALRRILSVLRG